MRLLLLVIVFLSEGIFSIRAIADTSAKRKTDPVDCQNHPQYCYDEEELMESDNHFYPTVTPKFGSWKTDKIDCQSHPQYCYDETKNNKIIKLNPKFALRTEPRITTGLIYYRYEDGLVGKLKGNMPFMGFGLLTSYKRWILDGYYQSSSININSDERDVHFIKVNANEEKENIFKTRQNRKVERDDYAVSLGYNCFDDVDLNLWLFLGYRGGKTAVDTDAVIWFENVVTTDERKLATELNVDTSFETRGPFIGAMIGTRYFGKDTLLGGSLGFTRLKGKYSFGEAKSESEEYGWKFGIDWNAPIGNIDNIFSSNISSRITVRYNLSLSAYRYKMNVGRTKFFKGLNMDQPLVFDDDLEAEFPVEEKIYSFRAALILQWW